MEKCDVCGKNSLLPETLGNSIICKKCLLKINGIMWKYRHIDDEKTLEKNRTKALELANKANFPEKVIIGINEYFDEHKEDMLKCDACGETMLTTHRMGDATICKKCYSKINTKEWKKDVFTSTKELDADKNKVVKLAKQNKFPNAAIEYIKDNFDSRVEKNWLYTIDGGYSQTLKVYKDYLIIKTDEDFDDETMEEEYRNLISDNNTSFKEGVEAIADVIGGISVYTHPVKTLIANTVSSYVSNSTDSSKTKKKKSKKEKINFHVKKGELKVNYEEYDSISLMLPNEDEETGFILIRNSKKTDLSDTLFFFENDSSLIKIIKEVIPFIEDKLVNTKVETTKNDDKSYEELRVLKKLLDDGIITEEDFEKKKKQILGL